MVDRFLSRFTALLLALLLVAPGCKPDDEEEEAEAIARDVPVETVEARRGDLREAIVTTSTVDSRNAVDVMAEIPGTLVSLTVEQGDVVERGQLIGRVNRAELDLGVDSARAAVARLEAEVERLRPLYEKGILARQQYDEAKYRLEEARAEQRRANISASDKRVVAPIDGVVAMRYVSPGQQVATGTPLVRVVQPDDLLVYVNLPEASLGRVFEKQEVLVSSDALAGRNFGAFVEKVSPVVDPMTGTVRVTIAFTELAEDERRLLRPGMFVKVRIVTSHVENVLVIPRRAVTDVEGETYVFVADDGVARRHDVTLGVSESTLVEVKTGLEEGDQVVVLGKDGLKEGTAVDAQPREADRLEDGS